MYWSWYAWAKTIGELHTFEGTSSWTVTADILKCYNIIIDRDKLSPFESTVAIARDPSISAKWSNPVRGRHQSFSTLGSSTLFPNLVTLKGWKAEYT